MIAIGISSKDSAYDDYDQWDRGVAPGTGFWYVSEGGAPVIKW